MTFKPAARNAAEFQERAHDELKQLEPHPSDCGSIVLTDLMAMEQEPGRRCGRWPATPTSAAWPSRCCGTSTTGRTRRASPSTWSS